MNTISQSSITVSDIHVSIDRKDIKNLHIGVYPPNGRVRVATPVKIDDEAVRLAVISKLMWIKKQVCHFQEQSRETKREMVSGESHYFLGKRYLLEVVYGAKKYTVVKRHSTIELHVNLNTTVKNRQKLLNKWYREQLQIVVGRLIVKWQAIINVEIHNWSIKKMRTKWGSCNIEKKNILLNLSLARTPVECIEYIVVHEMVHLLERHHNDNFKVYMDRYLPEWKSYRDILNQSILIHEEW
ncbi:M48 family metallopeptidase [Sulfurimonas sp. NW7]|uniref:M48 family metallopeptidase n=1 Tax=Sulfurimonas sp. NW7 TaxID=2922727 RepID=UPI003DA872FF